MSHSSGFCDAIRVPVHADAFQGLAEFSGMLTLDGEVLRLDYQTRDALVGLIKSGARRIDVPLEALGGVRSGAGWFWLMPWIELSLDDFALAAKLGDQSGNRWRFSVRFSDRKALRELVLALTHRKAESLRLRLERAVQRELDSLPVRPSSLPQASTVAGSVREVERGKQHQE